jgi:hypothetical protein
MSPKKGRPKIGNFQIDYVPPKPQGAYKDDAQNLKFNSDKDL